MPTLGRIKSRKRLDRHRRVDAQHSSAPSRVDRRTTRPPGPTPLAGMRWTGDPRRSHVHCLPVGKLGAQLFPCDIAAAAPWTFTMALNATEFELA